MNDGRLSSRNAAIAAMLADGEQLKNFYRFVAQNPHINLHDACQIIIERPNATVCYSFNEWAAMDRRVTKGRKGIAYYDIDGYKQFVFDANDTHGDNRYSRPILPMKQLLGGLDELNGTEIADSEQSDYGKIQKGVRSYLTEQGELTGDGERDGLLVEGITYSLYSKTGFPKSAGIRLSELPYSYGENAEFIKEVYIQTNLLAQDIEEAYRNKQEKVVIIDDTEEETVSDEPTIPVEQTVKDEPKHPMFPLYKRYMEMQSEKPEAIVLMRLGDFYEVWGEKSKVVSDELNLTLTGRDVGLSERIPMCGIPQHFLEEFLDKIRDQHGVLLVDDFKGESKYILSKAEALEQNDKPQLEEIKDGEPTPFDDEQSDADNDWRNELAAELGEMDDEQSDDETKELADSEEADEEDLDSSSDEQDEQEILEEPKVKDKKESTQKKPEKGIKDRKRKEKPQPTLFDLTEPQEKSDKEKFIENELLRGSYVVDGKFRIFDKYNENPSEKAFAYFLKKEYGIGGYYIDNTNGSYDAKGIELKWIDKEHPENNLEVKLKWNEAANRIADLIDDDIYFDEGEKKEYAEYTIKQNRLREQRLEEERQKNRLINNVIFAASSERKQRILDEYAKTTELTTFAEFLKNEYGTSEERGEGYSATYNEMGVWIFKGEYNHGIDNRTYLKWEEFADKVCTLIEDDRYIEQPEETLTDEQKIAAIADKFVKEGTEKTTDGKWIAYFNDYKEDEQFVREHKHEIAEQIVSHKEVTQVGVDDDSIDASFPLEYCPNYDWDADDKKENAETKTSEPKRFNELSQGGKAVFESYQQSYRNEPTTSPWDEVQNCTTIANGIYEVSTAGHGGIMIASGLAPYILSGAALRVGFEEGGYYCFEEDCAACAPLRELYDTGILKPEEYFKYYSIPSEQPEAKDGRIYFNKATESEKAEFIKRWNRSINESLQQRNEEYWKAYEIINAEKADSDNTDLNGVLDQSELGGAKTRFRNNVAAIRLVNKLYSENRNPTEAEKKVLSQFVGWGGLSQAFDENNPQWKKEYAELKGLLSQEDYEQARGSTLNAYYTAKDVIGGIYMALNRFGVKANNRILEPAMGTGNFFGFMPKEISDGSRLYGVELDNLTGRIAAKLYPQANVQIKGFEDTTFPNDKFDIVVGNVPFGGYGVADSDYNKYNFKVHDYFLAKSIDKVKPNGIVAIVTSKGTMDKLNPSARKYVAERAELLGAIRLPNTAFKQTAGTEAVADILFFRKRAEKTSDISNEEWLGTDKTEEGYEINRYFIKHPEMVLGTLAKETGLYGGVDVTVKSDGRELSEAIAEAVKNLPSDFYANPETSPEAESTSEVDYNVKPMCYKAENGRLYMRIGDGMEEQAIPKFPKDAYQRIQGMIALREELHHILDLQIQGCSDEVLESEQRKLNAQYDLFVKRYGNLNGKTNTRLFKDDGDSALLLACEEVDKETGAISKADVFTKRTIRPYVVPTNTDDCFEALQISKNERGRVDIAYIEELTGKSFDDVLFELGDAVFRDPEKVRKMDKYSGYVTSEEYLSGKVVSKLETARRYAEKYPEYQSNVTALEQVQPTRLTAGEISVRLGQTWVDKEFYKQFYMELIGAKWWHEGSIELFYNPHDSSWRLDQKDNVRYDTQMKQKEVYGTKRAPAYRLFIDCMNLKATTIYDTIEENGQERRVLNQAETIAAREKQNKIKEEFANWIFADPERREELEDAYNRLFNQIRLPSYDGSYLKFPEMNPAIELEPHQRNAVHRIIVNDQSTLLHHVVGAGKTFTMAASIMKMRQLGLCKKAMVVVPNHLVQQWAGEWRKLYPNAKILVATKEDLEKNNRKRFVSKVAMGDWDGIIIAQSSFSKIPVSTERQINKLNEEIARVEVTIQSQYSDRGMPRGAVKNLERIKKTKQAQLKKLMDDSKKDGVLTFENLGVDYLFIDEAHHYKNLFLYTKMNNVAGISNAASQRASDLKLKCEYLQEIHGSDKGIVFATGTPISNSMAEMYTMQSYLQPAALKESGLDFFDGWAANFGETITSMELAPSGQGYKARTRFAKFTNLPELLTMYRSFADVQTRDMLKLNVPEAERHVINLKPSDTVIELAESIADRAEKIHGGSVPPEEDNMLKVTSDGKKLALDPRCFDPMSEDENGSKLNEAVQRIYEIWENTAEKKGTQIVFCDLSTPKRRFEDYDYGIHFDAYNDLKHKLVQQGIPADDIAFIHEANSDEQKQALFDKVNSGAVRVLIGSTEKCGAGTNVQKRLVALHHLDTPYRPSDMEQREGRIIRQGNTNEKVDIYTYVTERTFDSYSYQILENKQKFIAQINRGDLTVREAEDIDETTLSYAEIKAITAANPRIKRKMEVDTEIARLRVLEGQFKKNLYDLQDKIRKTFPEDIRQQELLVERVTLDLMHLQSSKPEDPEAFEISVNGKVYTDRKEGGKALTDALYASKPNSVVAEYCGFKISMNPMNSLVGERDITLSAKGQYTVKIGESSSGNLTRLDNFIEDFPNRKVRLENKLAALKNDLEVAKEQVEKPFEHKEHLAELLKEQSELNAELDLDKKEESVIIDDGNDSGDEDNYRTLPTQKDMREVNIIDEEDKVAAMKVEVLPDYTITQEDMHEYGYKWDGMLPLNRAMAVSLWGMGLGVCKLGKDDDHTEVDDYRDFNDDSAIYGIEKPVWKRYIENEKAVPYLFSRLHITSAVSNMISDEMSYIDDKFIGAAREQVFRERGNLEDYLPYSKPPKIEEIKPYMPQLIEEFAERIWGDELKYYGWAKDDVPKSIAAHIADDELKNYAKRVASYRFDAQTELMNILNRFTDEEIEEMNLPAFDDELTVLAKEPSIYLNEEGKTYLPGLLMLHNEITGDYYVINDTSAKSKDGSELEVGDTTNVETVLAYNGMSDGNPLREFHDEREAKAYYDEKVNSIRSVKVNSEDYREAVVNSVLLEYDELQKSMLNSSSQEVLNNHYKIHCFERLSSAIEEDTEYLSDDEYKALYEERGNILNNIFEEYIGPNLVEGNNPTNLDSHYDIVKCIQSYCMENHSIIYNKKPVYLETAAYAQAHDELEKYHDSRNISLRCKSAISMGISNNFDGMRLNSGFEDEIIKEYGMERVAYLLATTIKENETDGRFSRANKDWANTIPISDSEDERRICCLNVHHAVLDGFTNLIRNKIKEEENTKLAQDKYLHFTARGDKVLSIVKDRDDRNIAIIQREKMSDFVVAAGYNTADGTWAQGKYDLKTLEAAEQYRTDKYGFENMSDTTEKKWLICKISPEALIKKYQFNSRFRMPKGSGYEGYAYSIFNDRIKEGTITTDLKSDTRERALVLHIPTNKKVEIQSGENVIELEPHDFISLVNETTSDKYEREQRYIAVFPPEAIIKEYDTSMLMAMPNDSKYKGYVYYMPSSVVSENTNKDDGSLIANIGESFKVTLRKGEEKVEITAKEYSELVGGKKADKYKREPSAMDYTQEQQSEDEKKWETVAISENAVIANYEKQTLFKMPKGEYAGLAYYIPSGMVKKEDDGLYLRIPEDFEVHLKGGEEKKDLTAQEFIAAIKGKTDEDYESIYRRPSEEARKQFEKVEQQLRKNVPEEMRNKPNWVVVRTRENVETGRLDKFLIDTHTGKFAESDNPETWADFETACKYARENGGVALAYALEWDSDIACIDLDGCMDENGDFSEIAQQSFNAANGSYAEKSVSGKGLHIFGKTKGADLRSFSKDKTMEYYQGGHFIAMTGDYYGSSELKSFDTPEMQTVLTSKLEKRTEWKNTGKGVEGLSSMDDREMLDRAFTAKNGDTVKRLYRGEDVRGNHSNSDMSLMNYLAFWSNHDIDQMLRVFATSGLYRPEKPQSYYEHTAIKAVKGTPCYTPPKASSNNKPSGNGNGNGSDKGGK